MESHGGDKEIAAPGWPLKEMQAEMSWVDLSTQPHCPVPGIM